MPGNARRRLSGMCAPGEYSPLLGQRAGQPEFRRFGGTAVYFDTPSGNQDPYLWNDAFLHSYCHITQFHAEPGDINLWVSGDRFPEFSSLYCDWSSSWPASAGGRTPTSSAQMTR